MKKSLLLALIACVGMATAPVATATPLVVCDFEDYAIGDAVPMWNCFGDTPVSTAVVEADPANPDNKVLHVRLSEWNTFVELAIPAPLCGKQITDTYSTLCFDIYRSATDENDWKQLRMFIGDEEVFDVDGYPNQGSKKAWQNRSYELKGASADNQSSMLHLGFHSEKSDYYIDNIVLKGRYDDYMVIDGGVLDLCKSNTSSSYMTYNTPLYVTIENPLTVYTSRYTEFKSDVVGDGPLSLYCGGERTYIGESSGSAYPNWSEYTGDIHVYPWKEIEKGAGFYGVILNHGGKRFNPEDIPGSLSTTNSQLINNHMILHDGATLAMPTGIRGVRIGTLDTEAGSRIFGAIKKSTSSTKSACYVMVGASGTDAVLAGEIRSVDDAGTPLGIIKEGAGTYRITGNDNIVNGAVRVLEGTVLVENDAAQARADKSQGAIGALADGTPGVYVFEGANLGGTGSVASVIDLYGNLRPGNDKPGTLTVADYATGKDVNLRLRPTSHLYFDIESATSHGCIDVQGKLDYYNIDQNFATSDKTPIIYINPTAPLQAGQKFLLVSAKGTTSLTGDDWAFRIQYPKEYTWQVTEEKDADSYRLYATVTSLEYSGQGDNIIDDNGGQLGGDDDDDDDGFDEKSDPTPLRQYASQLDKHIGVAVCTWRVSDFDNPNDPQIKTIAREFNALVAENEMKWDATEPSRGSFSYNDGDRIARLATDNNMYLRGHALAWHKQMPAWLSTDGGVKNDHEFTRRQLLGILWIHIKNVVGHYKGIVKEWDVVNECLSDDQSCIRTNPDAYDLRPSVWYTGIGEEFIDSAFVYTHRVDPDARLILNDYGVEFAGDAKAEAFFNLAKRLKNDGVPIDGVGLQCHLDAGAIDPKRLNDIIEKYASIGLDVTITELDLGINSKTEANLAQQAKDYRAIAKVAYGNPNCRGIIVWGFSDEQSWRSSNPLLYDSSHSPKPAYYSVHAALRRAVGADGIFTIEAENDATVVKTEYYDLYGRRLTHPAPGIGIKVEYLSNGQMRSTKTARR